MQVRSKTAIFLNPVTKTSFLISVDDSFNKHGIKICVFETGEILAYIKYLYNNTEHFTIQYFEVE